MFFKSRAIAHLKETPPQPPKFARARALTHAAHSYVSAHLAHIALGIGVVAAIAAAGLFAVQAQSDTSHYEYTITVYDK